MEKEYIYSYPNGSVYMGHMRNTDETGKTNQRHGRGTLRTPAFVYGMSIQNYTSDEAAENTHLAKWHEYIGTWENDNLHGYGIHVQKSGNGAEIVIFEGEWNNGKPVRSIHSSSFEDDTIFG